MILNNFSPKKRQNKVKPQGVSMLKLPVTVFKTLARSSGVFISCLCEGGISSWYAGPYDKKYCEVKDS